MANGNMDDLMLAMLMKKIMGDRKISAIPFKMEVAVTPISINCFCEGNKRLLADVEGGEEWFEETRALIEPIMKNQTTKFFELVKKKFGFEEAKEENATSAGGDFADLLNRLNSLFGGADR